MSRNIQWILWVLGLLLTLWMTFMNEGCRQSWEHYLCADCMRAEAGIDAEATTPEVIPPVVEEVQRAPIDFEWSNATAFQNEGAAQERLRLLEGNGKDKQLVIYGQYYADEPTPEGYANMGEARAAAILKILAPDVSPDQVKLVGELLPGSSKDVKDGYFVGYRHEWINAVEEVNGCTIIRFPYNSSSEEYNEEAMKKLDEIAEYVKTKGGKIVITGHTDSRGNEDYNMRLGNRRAKQVRQILRKKGVKRANISASSKGETNPIDAAENEGAWAKNRRVEVCLEK